MIERIWKTSLTALLCALAILGVCAPASAQNDEMTLIVSYGSGDAWLPLIPDSNALDPAVGQEWREKFKTAVRSLADENPEAVLVDLGGFTNPRSFSETAYGARSAAFFYDAEYAAVNATAKDYFQFAANGTGMRKRPVRMNDLFLSSMDHIEDTNDAAPLPASKVAETKAGSLELMSVADPENLSGIPLVIERARIKTPEEVIAPALETKEGLAILFSDFAPSKNDEFARTWPGLDLILETTEGDSARKVGSTFIQPRGDETEIQVLGLKKSGDGRIASVESKRVQWITPDEYKSLIDYPLPNIGMSVPPEGRVAERLKVEQSNVDLEVFRNQEFPDLTLPRPAVYVYHVKKDDRQFRVMRTAHVFHREWMNFDGLIQMNPDHTIHAIETNDPHYMLVYFPSRFQEVLNAIYDKPVEQWHIPQEAIKGYEERAEIVIETLRKTIELDKRLFPDQ